MTHVTLNRRRQAVLRDGRYHFTCRLCGGTEHEEELDDLERTECSRCEQLLWDGDHMVENDTEVGAKPTLRVI